jgi:hypothetical protein
MSNCYDHQIKINMLDKYYFKNKDEAKKNLAENKIKLKSWYQKQLTYYQNAEDNFDEWFTEYTGQSFDEMLKE